MDTKADSVDSLTAPADSGPMTLVIEPRDRVGRFRALSAIAALAGAALPSGYASSSEDILLPRLRRPNKYQPHQGAAECARRLRRMAVAKDREAGCSAADLLFADGESQNTSPLSLASLTPQAQEKKK